MKYTFLSILAVTISTNLLAQSVPKGISYQAVAINTENQAIPGFNNENTYWSNKDIQVKFTIYDQYPGGIAQMVETHQARTDRFGVFNVVIGQGQNISGDLFDVEWSQGTAHLQVEIDFYNDDKFKLIGIEKFWSVPYAIQSGNSSGGNSNDNSKKLDSLINNLQEQLNKIKSLNDRDSIIGNEFQDLTIIDDSLLISNGEGVKLIDNDANNELQTLRISNDSIILSGNNSGIKLPQNNAFVGDSSDQNELQDLTLIGDSLLISGGIGVNLIDNDPSNELQHLFLRNDTIGIDLANSYIALPKNQDNDSTNEIQNLKLSGDSLMITQGNTILLGSLINEKSQSKIFKFPDTTRMTDRSKTKYLSGGSNWTWMDTFKLITLKKGDKLKIHIPQYTGSTQQSWSLINESNNAKLYGYKQSYYQASDGIKYFNYDLGELLIGPRTTAIYIADKNITIALAMQINNITQNGYPGVPSTYIRSIFVEVN